MAFNVYNYDMSRTEWEFLIDQFIFCERDRKILARRLLDGVCFEPLAEEFDLSVQQTKSIVYKGLNAVLKHIK